MEIGESAFEDASGSYSVSYASAPFKLGVNAFRGFRGTTVNLRQNLEAIPRGAFANSKIDSLDIGSNGWYAGSIRTIEVGAFDNATIGVLRMWDAMQYGFSFDADAVFETATIGEVDLWGITFDCPLPKICSRPEANCSKCKPVGDDDV